MPYTNTWVVKQEVTHLIGWIIWQCLSCWCNLIVFSVNPENYSINDFLLQVAKSCFVPALFGHAVDDDFIQPHHSDRICEAYVVNFVLVNDEHLM